VSAGSGGDDDDNDDDDGRPLQMETGVDTDQKDPCETVAVWPEEALLQVGNYLRLSVSCFYVFPSPVIDLAASRVCLPQYHISIRVTIGSMLIIHRSL
jgi:hypothetical protein